MLSLDANAILESVLPFGGLFDLAGDCLLTGRTLGKVLGSDAGAFFDSFEVVRPRVAVSATSMAELCGKRLTLRMRTREQPFEMRGVVVAVQPDLFLLDVSLGTEVAAQIEALGLEERDFSYADPTVDMFYLVQAQAALLEDSQNLATRLSDAKDAAEALALTDPLTGLPNRRAAEVHINRILRLPAEMRKGRALIHLDLDRFKNANDTLGHAAGDAILQNVATCIDGQLGEEDHAARVGGDEFVIVLGPNHSEADLHAYATRLNAAIASPMVIEDQCVANGASIGMTWLDQEGSPTLDHLFREADFALYESKAKGRGKATLFDKRMGERLLLAQRLAVDIDGALRNDEFVPYFQPQLNALTGGLYGLEVLTRWHHPHLGVLPPAEYLYVAERAKKTEVIDRQVYALALAQLASWHQSGFCPGNLSLNITADQITSPDFADSMIDLVTGYGLAPGMVTFELLETIRIDDKTESQNAIRGAERLAAAGFGLALDDFGTGRASIASLVSIPSPMVKIDRRFISQIDRNEQQERLTGAIIGLAQDLGLDVLAEGVERQEEADKLREMGCALQQGFLYGKAAPAATIQRLLAEAQWMPPIFRTTRLQSPVGRAN